MEEVRYCQSCGAYLPTGQKKCLACGLPIEATKTEDNTDAIETTALEEDVFTVYADGKPLYDFIPKRKAKSDIDLDKLLSQEFFTVKIGGKVKWFYLGKADLEIGSTIYHTKDLFGKIVINEKGKNKFHLTMIER